jgi:hypothetical protein
VIDLLLYKRLLNERFLSYDGEIPSRTAIYNPFSGNLYFRGVYISGRQIFELLLADTRMLKPSGSSRRYTQTYRKNCRALIYLRTMQL